MKRNYRKNQSKIRLYRHSVFVPLPPLFNQRERKNEERIIGARTEIAIGKRLKCQISFPL